MGKIYKPINVFVLEEKNNLYITGCIEMILKDGKNNEQQLHLLEIMREKFIPVISEDMSNSNNSISISAIVDNESGVRSLVIFEYDILTSEEHYEVHRDENDIPCLYVTDEQEMKISDMKQIAEIPTNPFFKGELKVDNDNEEIEPNGIFAILC